MLCFGIDSSSMCRFRDMWCSLGTENQEGFCKSSDLTTRCMLFKPLPTLQRQKRSASLFLTETVSENQSPVMISAAEKWQADWQLGAWSLSWASRCVPLFAEGGGKHVGFVCVHLITLNFCDGESGALSRKIFSAWLCTVISKPFRDLHRVSPDKKNMLGLIRAHSDGLCMEDSFSLLVEAATGPLMFKHGLKSSLSRGKHLVVRQGHWSTKVKSKFLGAFQNRRYDSVYQYIRAT